MQIETKLRKVKGEKKRAVDKKKEEEEKKL